MLNKNHNANRAYCWMLGAVFFPLVLIQSGDVYQRRLEYVNALNDIQRRELKNKYDRFKKLSESDLNHVRSLHESINREPNTKQLQVTLSKYHEWLKTLRPQVRAEVLSLKDQRRIEQIRYLQVKQHQKTYGIKDNYRISNVSDISVVYRWLRESIYKNVRNERIRKHREKTNNMRPMSMGDFLELIIGSDELIELFFPTENLNVLYNKLSAESKIMLEELQNDEERLELVIQWCRSVVKRRITKEQRNTAYETLTPEQKAIVDGMSIENRRNYLDRVYMRLKRNR